MLLLLSFTRVDETRESPTSFLEAPAVAAARVGYLEGSKMGSLGLLM